MWWIKRNLYHIWCNLVISWSPFWGEGGGSKIFQVRFELLFLYVKEANNLKWPPTSKKEHQLVIMLHKSGAKSKVEDYKILDEIQSWNLSNSNPYMKLNIIKCSSITHSKAPTNQFNKIKNVIGYSTMRLSNSQLAATLWWPQITNISKFDLPNFNSGNFCWTMITTNLWNPTVTTSQLI